MGATPLVLPPAATATTPVCTSCCRRSYNAEGGGGTGTVQQLGGNKLQLTFDSQGTSTLQQHQQQVSCCAVNSCVGMVDTRCWQAFLSSLSSLWLNSCCWQLLHAAGLTWQCCPWRYSPALQSC